MRPLDDVFIQNVRRGRSVAEDLATIFVSPLPLGQRRGGDQAGEPKSNKPVNVHPVSLLPPQAIFKAKIAAAWVREMTASDEASVTNVAVPRRYNSRFGASTCA